MNLGKNVKIIPSKKITKNETNIENISTPKKEKMVILSLKVSSFLKGSKFPNSKFPILNCKIAKNVWLVDNNH